MSDAWLRLLLLLLLMVLDSLEWGEIWMGKLLIL